MTKRRVANETTTCFLSYIATQCLRRSMRMDRGAVVKSVLLVHVVALITVLVAYRAMSRINIDAATWHQYTDGSNGDGLDISIDDYPSSHFMPSSSRSSYEHHNETHHTGSVVISISRAEAMQQILFHKEQLKIRIAHAEHEQMLLLSAIRKLEEEQQQQSNAARHRNEPSQQLSAEPRLNFFSNNNNTGESFISTLAVVVAATVERKKNIIPAEQPVNTILPAPLPSLPMTIAVLVIACDRPSVRRNLDLLVKYRDSAGGTNMTERFPIVVSQDCGHAMTAQTIAGFVRAHKGISHIRQPDRSNIVIRDKSDSKFQGYYKICRHYRWALNHVFRTLNYSAVIIVEDDLDVAPDFFEYFQATLPVLMADRSLWCVSAWNDNGKPELIDQHDHELLHRTDFFPGLGWMMLRTLWDELEPKWPEKFWDDWMRRPEQRQNRSCIRPEIPRTITFGKKGVSKGQFFEQHLKYIKLNDEKVPFTQRDLRYLLTSVYDARFNHSVYAAPAVTLQNVKSGSIANVDPRSPVRLTYQTKSDFIRLASDLGAMTDLKAGVARTAYHGVVTITYRGRRVFLAPPVDWAGYDTSWS